MPVVVQCSEAKEQTSTALWGLSTDAIANGACTLIGALLGAMVAYWLQRLAERIRAFEVERAAAHRFKICLINQINTIVLIQKNNVFPELEKPGRFLSIRPTAQFDTKKFTLSESELTFLLRSSAGRKIILEFLMAQENYIEALNAWNMRSALHFEKVQPAMAVSGVASGVSFVTSEAHLKGILGEHTYGTLVDCTDNCIESLRRAFKYLVEVNGQLNGYLASRYKGKKGQFLDISVPETYGLSDS
ncbi:MAG TPA: hypothetical protein VNZ68_06830 [Rhodocyclaceae bacterium]|nr:hypothetical protein [Rhodocyclaceae bacterium]